MADEQDDSVNNMMEVFDLQIKSQGIGVITVKDGTMLMLPADTLRKILEQAEASPKKKALVFVKHAVGS